MTTPIDAAERLRRLNNGDGIRDVYQCDHYRGVASAFLKDQREVIDARLRETDPTLITIDFARSVAVEQGNGFGFNDDMKPVHLDVFYFGHAKQLHLIGDDIRGWTLKYSNQLICNVCTIGHFYTACRLFGVMLKD